MKRINGDTFKENKEPLKINQSKYEYVKDEDDFNAYKK